MWRNSSDKYEIYSTSDLESIRESVYVLSIDSSTGLIGITLIPYDESIGNFNLHLIIKNKEGEYVYSSDRQNLLDFIHEIDCFKNSELDHSCKNFHAEKEFIDYSHYHGRF